MRLPSFRRIMEQDYAPDQQELIRHLSVSVNSGFEPLYEVLNGKFSFTDNSSSIFTTVVVELNASGKPKVKTNIRKTNTERFQGIMVLRAINLTNPNVYPSATPLISYTETVDNIVIDHVSGLPADNIFQLTVFAIR